MTGLATREQRPNLHYDLVDPETGARYPPPPARGWAYEPSTTDRLIAEKRILWPQKQDGRPRLKKFLSELDSEYTGFSTIRDAGLRLTEPENLKSCSESRFSTSLNR